MNNHKKGSLTDFYTLNDWVGQIDFELSHGKGKKVILLVEGKNDEQFFKRIFGEHNKRIAYILMGGVKKLQDLMKLLNDMKERGKPHKQSRYIDSVVAVRDRDYTNPDSYPAHLFAYDDCAMELMILHNPSVRESLRGLYVREDKKFPLDAMRHIALFSLLRRENAIRHLNIPFKGDIPIKLVKGNKYALNMQEIFQICENRWPPCPEKDEGLYALCQNALKALQDDEDLWLITNGHDICKVLARFSKLGGKPIDETQYFDIMLTTYRPSDFRGTKLYEENLSAYELPDKTRPFHIGNLT